MTFLRRFMQRTARFLLSSSCHPRFGNWPAESFEFSRLSFSQGGEDLLIERLLQDIGRQPPYSYIDVGCFHPFEHSNTFRLYQHGGSGLVVDLNDRHRCSFARWRPRDKFVCAAVSDLDQKLAASIAGRPSDRLIASDDIRPNDFRIQPVPLRRILGEWWPQAKAVDLLDVDCEGHDLEVLRSNDWDRYRPALVLVEDFALEGSSDIESFMSSVGYSRVSRAGASSMFINTLGGLSLPS